MKEKTEVRKGEMEIRFLTETYDWILNPKLASALHLSGNTWNAVKLLNPMLASRNENRDFSNMT